MNTLTHYDTGVLRFLTCGSVDDGKSTIIGRLLHDSKAILSDTLAHITNASARRGLQRLDLSMLTDGLQAEREQGITIDVAYRYFTSGHRKFIIADAPGHEQYTRNMVTAASNAHAAVLLLDVRTGMTTQTRRHAYIANLLGIRHHLYVVNKMDLVSYRQDDFERVRAEIAHFAARLDQVNASFLPASALLGEHVVHRDESMPWYQGPTLLEWLEQVPLPHTRNLEAFRYPVQFVARGEPRGYLGRVASGRIAVGDKVTVLPSGQQATVSAITLSDQSLSVAVADQSVTLQLDRHVDISRGDMLVAANESEAAPQVTHQCRATMCWLSEKPLDMARRYWIRHTTRQSQCRITAITRTIDVNTLAAQETQAIKMNDIAEVTLKFAQPLCVDSYRQNRQTGAAILIDEATNNTVSALMLESPDNF